MTSSYQQLTWIQATNYQTTDFKLPTDALSARPDASRHKRTCHSSGGPLVAKGVDGMHRNFHMCRADYTRVTVDGATNVPPQTLGTEPTWICHGVMTSANVVP